MNREGLSPVLYRPEVDKSREIARLPHKPRQRRTHRDHLAGQCRATLIAPCRSEKAFESYSESTVEERLAFLHKVQPLAIKGEWDARFWDCARGLGATCSSIYTCG
jgi:hypothetical protein